MYECVDVAIVHGLGLEWHDSSLYFMYTCWCKSYVHMSWNVADLRDNLLAKRIHENVDKTF